MNLPSYREGGQWLPLRGVCVPATRVPRPLATQYKLSINHYSLVQRTRHALKATLGREPFATPAPPSWITHNIPCAAWLTVRSHSPVPYKITWITAHDLLRTCCRSCSATGTAWPYHSLQPQPSGRQSRLDGVSWRRMGHQARMKLSTSASSSGQAEPPLVGRAKKAVTAPVSALICVECTASTATDNSYQVICQHRL